MSSSRLSSGLLALLAAVASPCAPAAEWLAEPSITGRAEYNDNIRWTTAAHDSVWGLIIDPRLSLSRRTELWDLQANGRLRASRYEGQDGLDTVDSFFEASAQRRFERGSFDASAGLTNDTTLQDEVLDLDTGLVTTQIDRTLRNLGVTASYMLTEDTWVEASLAYSAVDYDNGTQFGLLDYDYLTPSLQLIHQINPRTQVFGVLSHAKVDYDSRNDLESKTDSLQVGVSYDFSERWQLKGSVGSRRTQTSQTVFDIVPRPGLEIFFPFIYDLVGLPRDSETTGLVYDATLTREYESGSLALNASRSILPSSTGTDTDTTSVTLNADRRFSAKLSGRLAVSYFQSETVGDTRTLADRDRYRVAPSLTWNLDRDLRLSAGYAYTRLSRGSTGSDAVDSNAAYVSLGYTWPRMAVSR